MSREAVIGTVVAALSVWVVLAVSFLPHQTMPGGDFMQFYALGAAARYGEWTIQYDWPRLHDLQVALVPGSADFTYRPSYPPLVPVFYAPLSVLPFHAAYAVWAIGSAALYAGLIALAARYTRRLCGAGAVAGALIFPPFIALILAGQTTLLVLTGFIAAWRLLLTRRHLLAGVAFSLTAFKPNFGIALAAVLILTKSWRIIAGVLIALAAIAGATWMICGSDAIAAWVTTTMSVLRNPALIEPTDDRHTHALRMTLEMIVTRNAAVLIWLAVSGVAISLAVVAWQRGRGDSLAMSGLLFATIIVSPHVLSYDAVLLAPACLWVADHALSHRRWLLAWATVVLAVLFVVPDARIAGVPLTVPLALVLLVQCSAAREPA